MPERTEQKGDKNTRLARPGDLVNERQVFETNSNTRASTTTPTICGLKIEPVVFLTLYNDVERLNRALLKTQPNEATLSVTVTVIY